MSIALVLGTVDRVVAASDSRALNKAYHPPRVVDTVRKIDICDRHLFAATGRGDLALDAWRVTPPAAGDSAQRGAERILDTMRAGLAPDTAHDDLLFGIFRFGGAWPDAHAIKLRVSGRYADVLQTGAPVTVPFAMCFGFDDYPNTVELLTQAILPQLQKTPMEAAMVSLARETIRWAGEISPKIGGPIHAAVLDAGGARWVS